MQRAVSRQLRLQQQRRWRVYKCSWILDSLKDQRFIPPPPANEGRVLLPLPPPPVGGSAILGGGSGRPFLPPSHVGAPGWERCLPRTLWTEESPKGLPTLPPGGCGFPTDGSFPAARQAGGPGLGARFSWGFAWVGAGGLAGGGVGGPDRLLWQLQFPLRLPTIQPLLPTGAQPGKKKSSRAEASGGLLPPPSLLLNLTPPPPAAS